MELIGTHCPPVSGGYANIPDLASSLSCLQFRHQLISIFLNLVIQSHSFLVKWKNHLKWTHRFHKALRSLRYSSHRHFLLLLSAYPCCSAVYPRHHPLLIMLHSSDFHGVHRRRHSTSSIQEALMTNIHGVMQRHQTLSGFPLHSSVNPFSVTWAGKSKVHPFRMPIGSLPPFVMQRQLHLAASHERALYVAALRAELYPIGRP